MEDIYENSFSGLPAELCSMVLAYLDPGDLCRVMLTCRMMQQVSLKVWSGMTLRPRKEKMQREGIEAMLSFQRYDNVRRMDMSKMYNNHNERLNQHQYWFHLFNYIQNSKIKILNLSENILSEIPAPLLASAVAKLHTIILDSAILGTDHLAAILTASLSSNTLQVIDLHNLNIESVPAALLGQALSRFKTINLEDVSQKSYQMTAFLTTSLISTTLQDLNLYGIDLSHVPGPVLAQAIIRLKIINLGHTDLTTDQLTHLFTAILTSRTLSSLILRFNSLSGVAAPLLGQAASRLIILDLYSTNPSIEAITEFFRESLISGSLLELNIGSNHLSHVSSPLLSQTVSRLKVVNLESNLSTLQITDLLTVSLDSTTLEDLSLQCNVLTSVEASLLAQAVWRLKRINLDDTSLTAPQIKQLLSVSLSSTTLKTINLSNNDLSSIPASLLSQAAARLKKINLSSFVHLSTEQLTSILEAILTSPTLEDVNLRYHPLPGVPASTLSQAVSRLKRLNLAFTRPTTDQLTEILKATIDSRTIKTVNLSGSDLSGVPVSLVRKSEHRAIM